MNEKALSPYYDAISANESLKRIIDFILIYSNTPVPPELKQAYTQVRSYIEDQVLFHDPEKSDPDPESLLEIARAFIASTDDSPIYLDGPNQGELWDKLCEAAGFKE